jgi:outer membrane protein assembly factor BamD
MDLFILCLPHGRGKIRPTPCFSTEKAMTQRSLLPVLLVALLLSACSGSAEQKARAKEAESQVPVEKLYNDAAAKLDAGEFLGAAKAFEEVDRQYPYSQWAAKSQLMAGYARYKFMKYDEAVVSLDQFLELHPGDPNAAYAWYLKALCYYEQITDVGRDQKMTQLSLDALQQVVQRYPDSKYAKDAALKIDLTRDHLAGKEMDVGRYYLDRAMYQAAINRFQKVVTQYQTTTHAPEALHRMVEGYLALGLRDEARKSAAILGHNYPRSAWYRDSYRLMGGDVPKLPGAPEEKKSSLFGRIFD